MALESKPSLEMLELEAGMLKSILPYWCWLFVFVCLEKAGLVKFLGFSLRTKVDPFQSMGYPHVRCLCPGWLLIKLLLSL